MWEIFGFLKLHLIYGYFLSVNKIICGVIYKMKFLYPLHLLEDNFFSYFDIFAQALSFVYPYSFDYFSDF